MAFFNYQTNSVAIKVVYYGPGLSGKTTNLRYIHLKLEPNCRGDLLCLESDTDRTFFFDLLPISAGLCDDFKIHFQLMTVPGQVYYEASRKSVLKNADGIVFVADSQTPLLDANLECFDGLRRNLLELNIDLNLCPMVFQYNKRDLEDLIPVETFNSLLNPRRAPFFEAAAITGKGVFETLRSVAGLTIPIIRERIRDERRVAEEAASMPEPLPESEPEPERVSEYTESRQEWESRVASEPKVNTTSFMPEDMAMPEEPPIERPVDVRKTMEQALEERAIPTPADLSTTRIKHIKITDEMDVAKELERLSQEFLRRKPRY